MSDEQKMRAFEAWYYEEWSHGETTPVHHAHKKGCWMAWQAAQAESAKELEALKEQRDFIQVQAIELGRKYHDKNVALELEIERLKRVVDAAKALEINWTHCCDERPMVEICGVMFVAPLPMDYEIGKAIGAVKGFVEALSAAEKECAK